MPVFNGIEYLDKSIRSILVQSYEDFEFVIIDDASTEPVWELLNSYSDKRLVLYRNTTNIGLTKSLNRYLPVLHGDFIARHDGDDIALPERFHEELAAFVPQIGLVSCWAKAINQDGAFLPSPWEDQIARVNSEEVIDKLATTSCIVAPGAIFRKEVVQKIGYFDEELKMAQDYNYWLRLLPFFNIHIIEKVLVWKRSWPGTVWNSPQTIDWIALARERAMQFPIVN